MAASASPTPLTARAIASLIPHCADLAFHLARPFARCNNRPLHHDVAAAVELVGARYWYIAEGSADAPQGSAAGHTHSQSCFDWGIRAAAAVVGGTFGVGWILLASWAAWEQIASGAMIRR